MRFVKNRTETCRARNAEEARKAREREREEEEVDGNRNTKRIYNDISPRKTYRNGKEHAVNNRTSEYGEEKNIQQAQNAIESNGRNFVLFSI